MAGNIRKSDFNLDDRAFQTALDAQFKRMGLNSKREVNAVGMLVKNTAQELSPVDTGRLRNAWYTESGDDEQGPWIDVANDVEYVLPTEFGGRPHEIPNAWGTGRTVTHPGVPAQPMIRPALLEAATNWKPRIVEG